MIVALQYILYLDTWIKDPFLFVFFINYASRREVLLLMEPLKQISRGVEWIALFLVRFYIWLSKAHLSVIFVE